MGSFAAVWIFFIFAIGLNAFAAGVVAILYVWRRAQNRNSRAFIAAISAGSFPFSWLIPTFFEQLASASESPFYLGIGGFILFAVATVVSLPAAMVVSRKLDSAGDVHRTFE